MKIIKNLVSPFFLVLILVLNGCGGGKGGNNASVNTPPVEDPVKYFDSLTIRDEATANCTFANARTVVADGVTTDVVDVSFTSWEYINGAGLQEITIQAYMAKPAALTANIPAVVFAHGLGGYAEETATARLAVNINAYVLAYSGPGAGQAGVASSQSGGLASDYNNGYRLFDTLEDVRGSWIWGHTVAAMRALTCLENRGDVDPARLGVSGISAGGIATLLAASLDDRIVAAVPVSASLAFDRAVESANAWQHVLLANAGLTTTSQEWKNLLSSLGLTGGQTGLPGSVFMINGSSDEYFPLQAHMATYNTFSSSNKRTSLIGNFDHGCLAAFGIPGLDAAVDIQSRAQLRIVGGQKAWFQHRFATNSDFSVIPATPVLNMVDLGGATSVIATPDITSTLLDVEEVRLWASADNGLTFLSLALTDNGDGTFSEIVPVPMSGIDVAYVDVQYRNKAIIATDRFSVSSEPRMTPGFIQHVLDSTCQP